MDDKRGTTTTRNKILTMMSMMKVRKKTGELILKTMILMMRSTLMRKPVMLKKNCMTIEGSVGGLQGFKRLVVEQMSLLEGMSVAKCDRMKIICY